jgi:stearoyl-CoA desaturase (delta-9 desaturase)
MVPMRAAHDLLRDKFLLSLHQNYYTVLWGVCLIAAVIHPMLFLFGLVLPMVISMHEENIVNVVCHTRKLGYRRYDTHDDSVNNWVLGTLFWGQGFHNTHHAQPSAYDFGRKWWEVDFSKFLIRMIAINGKERPAHDR